MRIPVDAGAPSCTAKRYMPFAEGPRDCLGQNLAKTSLLASLATLIAHLHFDLADRVGCTPIRPHSLHRLCSLQTGHGHRAAGECPTACGPLMHPLNPGSLLAGWHPGQSLASLQRSVWLA